MTGSRDATHVGWAVGRFSSPILTLVLILALSGTIYASSPSSIHSSNVCSSHKTCSGCILVDAGCFWNISSSSCVYIGDIDYELHSNASFGAKRHLPIENVTLWLQTRPDAALDLGQCPDLQCLLINVSFSYISCSSQGKLTFAAMVALCLSCILFWLGSLHFERKAAAQEVFLPPPSPPMRSSAMETVRKGFSTNCLDCGVLVTDLAVIDGSFVPLCRLCRIISALDRHTSVINIFLPAIYVVWSIGGSYLFIYSGLLFMAGSLSLTLNQLINDRFYTDITWKEYADVILSLFKRNSADNGLPNASITLNSSSTSDLEQSELSVSSRELLQSIKSVPARNAVTKRILAVGGEVIWVFERHNMLQHPWTRTFKGMLALTIGMILTGFALSAVLLTQLPAYGPIAVSVTVGVIAMVALASPAVFLTREVFVLTTNGVFLASKRPFGLVVMIGYISRQNALKCYISMRGFEANSSKASDMLSKPVQHRASIGFRIAPFQGLDIEDTYEVEKLKQALLTDPWNLTPVPESELAPSSAPATAIRQFLYAIPLVIAALFLMGGGTGIGALARGVMWSSLPALLGLSFAIWSVYSSSIVTLWFETGRPIPLEAPFKPPRLTRDNSLIAMRT